MSTELAKKYEELIKQLKELLGTKPLFYLKFCRKKEYAQDVCNGKLYANTVDFFRKIEIESGEHGQGDKNELILSMVSESISMFDNETGNLIAKIDGGKVNIAINKDEKVPIVSFIGISLEDMKIIYADETHVDFQLPFSTKEYSVMQDKFGQYCVIIYARELEQHIDNAFKSKNCKYIFDSVQYCCINRLDRIYAFANCNERRFLYKNEDFSYQREYRLAVNKEMPNDHYLRIGKIKNAYILPSESLHNIAFTIKYTSKIMEKEIK